MDRSVFGSAIKVYPSKNNRTSRSYRPSSFAPQHTNIFDDDEELDVFDKLVNDEKVKGQNQSSLVKSFVDETTQFQISKCSTLLRDVGNTDHVLSENRCRIKKKTKTKKRDKENIKHESRLYYEDDDDDPYFFNFNFDTSTDSKSNRRRERGEARTISKLALREQRLKHEKLKKAQELREKQQMERAKSRMSKVCSTPNKNAESTNEEVLNISRISKVNPFTDRFSSITSTTDKTEKSSDIFMHESPKRVMPRKKWSFVESFIETIKEERKTVSPEFDLSCCDNDNHKNSGSSEVRSVESDNTDFLTCLKIENSNDKKTPENKSAVVGGCCSLEKSKTCDGTNFSKCLVDEIEVSAHSVSDHVASQGTHASQANTCRSIIEQMEDMSIHNCDQNEKNNDTSSTYRDSLNNSSTSVSKFSRSELKVLNSEKPSEESGDEVEELAGDVENIHLSDTSEAEISYHNSTNNSSPNVGSGCSFHLSENEIFVRADELKNLTSRRSTRIFSRLSRASEFDSSTSSNLGGSQSPKHLESANEEEYDCADKSNLKTSLLNEQSDIGPYSLSNTINSLPRTRFFSRRSSRYSNLFDTSLSANLSPAENVNPDKEITSKLAISPISRILLARTRASVFESVLEENEEETEERSVFEEDGEQSESIVVAEHNFTMRKKRTFQFPRNDVVSESPRPEVVEENSHVMVAVNSRRGTRYFDRKSEISENNTLSSDETFVTNEETIVQIIATSDEKTVAKNDVLNITPEVTLKLDDLSPIEKVHQASIPATAKATRRTEAMKHLSVFSAVLEEDTEQTDDTNENKRLESTRTAEMNATKIVHPATGEVDVENKSGNSSSEWSFNTTTKQLSRSRFNSTVVQGIYLEKGKKWRRSFITFKNIMNHRLAMVEKENCGRFCNKRIENLISLQNDATIIMRELQECSTLKTGFDETVVAGFEEGDTISAKCERPEKARFSLSVNVLNLSCDVDKRNSRIENVGLSYLRESLIDHHEVQAGDFSNILRSSLPLLERNCTTDVAREIVLKYCNQSEPVPFEMCFPDSVLKSCVKIGEGVYGEVFMLKRGSKRSVIKIIPIEGDQLVNGEKQKTFEEIFSELVITVHLSDLKRKGRSFYTECFAELRNRYCVYGRYPQRLITLWKEYDLTKGSENDSPTMFKEDQLYVILELDHGGEDIESFAFNNAQQTLSVFNQVTNALAVAEQAFQFEHRDLHWGNVLVTRSSQKKTNFVIRNQKSSVKLNGVKVTLIDFTLSRITIAKHTLFNDLGKDPDLFIADGDFQFEVYRMMRKAVGNVWNRFVPTTNVYWLRYLLDKMVKEIRYLREGTMLHDRCFKQLENLLDRVVAEDFDSTYQIVKSEYRFR